MHRIATAVGLLLLMSAPVVAQKEFEPVAAERKTIDDYIDKTAGDSELEQMSKCIGLIADPCVDAPGGKHLQHRRMQHARADNLGRPAKRVVRPGAVTP